MLDERPGKRRDATNHLSFNHSQQPRDAFAKSSWFRDQAQHKIPIARKIVEVSRMHDDARFSQQINSQLFISSQHRNAQHDVPTAFDL